MANKVMAGALCIGKLPPLETALQAAVVVLPNGELRTSGNQEALDIYLQSHIAQLQAKLDKAVGLLKGIQYSAAQAPVEYRGSHTTKSITIESSQEAGINALLAEINNESKKDV